MAKTYGGIRENAGGSQKAPKNYTASVSVINKNGETRWLQKSFRTQKQGEKWIDDVAERFDSPSKAGFATTAAIDKDTKKGTQYDIFNRDLTREFEAKDKREFKKGNGGYTGSKKRKTRKRK